MIKLASFSVFTELADGPSGQQFLARVGNMPDVSVPSMAAMVALKRAEDVIGGWKTLVVPTANEEFRDIIKQQPNVKKWAAFGSEITRYSAVTYRYSEKAQKMEADLKALKEKERGDGTAIAIPSTSAQEFKMELVKPFVDTLPF